MDLIEQVKHARRACVPLVSLETADPMAAMRRIVEALNGKAPAVAWDAVRGCWPLNDAGRAVAAQAPETEQAPARLLKLAEAFPERTAVFLLGADRLLDLPGIDGLTVCQAAWNLRDLFKQDGRTLVLVSPGLALPAMLKDDVVTIDDPLPDEKHLREIVEGLDAGACEGNPGRARADEESVARAVEAVSGLSAFAAEQAVAQALRADGIDLDHAWQLKRRQVEQTRGLSIYRGGETFADLGGLEAVKSYLSAVMGGRKPPRTVVWLDEIEKTGLSARADTSGVSQDQEGTLLSWMEDMDVFGVMLLGVPGCGKSAICKAVGSEFGRVVIRLDLGAMQGSLVGQSQQQIRQALKVVEAVGGKDTLWLATSNSISGLSAAMRSRFTDTFFFDLPSQRERLPIWDVWIANRGLDERPWCGDGMDDGWVGRNIRQCCDKAWRMRCSLEEAARWVVPVGRTERADVEALREQADGRFLSASEPGVYRRPGARRQGGARAVGLS